MTERVEVRVHGLVQGVGFRWFTVQEARRRGLTGWVVNVRDGTVRAVAEGPSASLDGFLAALGKGPAGSRVDRVDAERRPAEGGFSRFELRSGSHPGD